MEYLSKLCLVTVHSLGFATSMRITLILIAQVGDLMRKLQRAFVVVAMLGSAGLVGAGTAQAGGTTDPTDPHTCTVTAKGGDGGAGGSATADQNDINQVIIISGDQ